jgi:ribosomal protein S19
LAPTAVDKGKEWKNCKLDLKKCSAAQLKTVQGNSIIVPVYIGLVLNTISSVYRDLNLNRVG